MENTNDVLVPEHYNANQLVTYKKIENDVVSFPTIKVNDLEWELDRQRSMQKRIDELNNTISRITDNMTEESWYNPNTEAAEILNDLCEILQYSPVKTIDFTANVTINGQIDIPMNEVEDFDLDSFIYDVLSIDTYHGNVEIHDWDVNSVDEC